MFWCIKRFDVGLANIFGIIVYSYIYLHVDDNKRNWLFLSQQRNCAVSAASIGRQTCCWSLWGDWHLPTGPWLTSTRTSWPRPGSSTYKRVTTYSASSARASLGIGTLVTCPRWSIEGISLGVCLYRVWLRAMYHSPCLLTTQAGCTAYSRTTTTLRSPAPDPPSSLQTHLML